MSLSAQVHKAVEMAFRAAGDLIKKGLLYKVGSSSFSFASNEVSSQLPLSFEVDVLDVSTRKREVPANEVVKEFLLKTKQVTELTTLDYVVIDGIKWQIRDVQLSNGFTSSVTVVKE